ncbi:HAD family hydrolase [Arthrobacter sp. StoSoilB5]|uniref:HAD family hydrolase n=1 Tax=Arthrobacter sp. StoSoilB5 TaxID=2830992 RepID=UPI001CC81D2D|nr:HAD family hydrolase [Arthrobacter sp. StoSoilB5]BCW44900.1 hypothetical protein StoSoilB5_20840 [Arthrobacter sp. StoSoilB5]
MTPVEGSQSLFDLDGVLIRTDTMAALISRRLAARPWRLVAAFPVFLIAVLSPSESTRRPRMNRLLVSIALRGMNRASYDRFAVEVARDLASGTAVVHEAVEACRAASANGPTAVVTASEETLARAYMNFVGLAHVALLASRLDFPEHPRLSHHNVAHAKVAAVKEAGFTLRCATLYTDSASDLPLAREVENTVIVNANARSTALLQSASRSHRSVNWR